MPSESMDGAERHTSKPDVSAFLKYPNLESIVMETYLINHLRIPDDVPNAEGLDYLEQVEATVAPMAASGSLKVRVTSSRVHGRAPSC